MPTDNDWRLSFQTERLHGVRLVRKAWTQTRPDWDHDHCSFCWAKFGDAKHAEYLHEGYATVDDYDWVCSTCYNDFRARFQWQLE
jgi:hypothetical protein